MGLNGKIALVTGGGTGIGKALAEALAEGGARVAVASRNPAHLKFAAGSRSFMPVEMDVRDKSQIRSGVAKIHESWGPVDILINNAGISGLTAMSDADDGRWRDI